MASPLPHRAPAAGTVIKKILAINPEMGTREMIALIRECTSSRGKTADEFASAEIIDEDKALRLARASLEWHEQERYLNWRDKR